MTRKIAVLIETDHDDTVAAIYSVEGAMARAGYNLLNNRLLSPSDSPGTVDILAHAWVSVVEPDVEFRQDQESSVAIL